MTSLTNFFEITLRALSCPLTADSKSAEGNPQSIKGRPDFPGGLSPLSKRVNDFFDKEKITPYRFAP